MMTREEIRELAAFQADESKGACALSFYFQPNPPQDRSHRSEAIVAKDVVKQALKSAAAQGKNGSLHALCPGLRAKPRSHHNSRLCRAFLSRL